ncbi:MAG: hypothetical protein ACKOD2_04170 [Ilumatobacteraceae bacterium]
MRLFVLGAPCSGKSTIAGALHDDAVIDVDDEIVRLNGGTWPDIETKNEKLLPAVLEAAAQRVRVLVLNSYMPLKRTRWLKAQGFEVVLLDVPVDELRRRDAVRFEAEGWTNREWFDWHQAVIGEHLDADLIDHLIDGSRPTAAVAADLRRLLDQP